MVETNNNLLVNNELDKIQNEDIKSLIYTIRGKQVMLDSDVARLYDYKTKVLNLTVRRNIERFPEEFCFQLTEKEFDGLRFQIETSNEKINNNLRGGRRYLPYVFTEQGIAMLAGVLKNETAVQISINIIKSFVEMKKILTINGQVFERLTKVEYELLKHNKKFDQIFNELQKNKREEINQTIFFEGQIYDAYSLIIKIIKKAEEKITIIDNYIDDTILDMLTKKNKNVKVVILTSNKSNISKIDVQKFNKEYSTLEITKTNKFHDRFIIIDNKELYHCGASLKDLGKKCFAINKMENMDYIKILNNRGNLHH